MYKTLMMMSLPVLLASGCAKINGDTYCDLSAPMMFDSERTVDWLLQNDRALLSGIVTQNETYDQTCV